MHGFLVSLGSIALTSAEAVGDRIVNDTDSLGSSDSLKKEE